MQAARNWRDEFEERDTSGNTVVYVNYRPGDRVEYAYIRGFDGQMFIATSERSGGRLIPKPRPKTLRPYRRGEVKCGDVFRGKSFGNDCLVTRVFDDGVILADTSYSYRELFDFYTRLDGTPAGVEE